MSPEVQQKMNRDMLERMGELLTKHGAALFIFSFPFEVLSQ